MEERMNPQIYQDDEMEIDWANLISKVIRKWKFILSVGVLCGCLGVGVALLQKRTYTVGVTLAPETQGKSGGSSLGGIASMLGMGNITAGSGTDALNISLFPEISVSTPFLTSLFDVQVTPYVSKKELEAGAQPATPMRLFDYLLRNEGKGLLAVIFGTKPDEEDQSVVNISQLTKKQQQVVLMLSKSISANVDKKTAITSISVTMDDPQVATQLADTVCQRLQDYIIDYRTKKAQEDLDYYSKMAEEAREKMVKAQVAYARSVDYDRSVILQSVNSEKERLQTEAQFASQVHQQMVTQREAAKAKYQEMKPVFAVIEPATFPLNPSSTSRKNIVLGFLVLGIVGAGAWAIWGDEYWNQFKELLKQKSEEEENA